MVLERTFVLVLLMQNLSNWIERNNNDMILFTRSILLALNSKLRTDGLKKAFLLTKYWTSGGLPIGYIHSKILNWNGGYTSSLLLIRSLSSFTDFYAAGSRIVIWISKYPISTLENLFLWRMSNQGYICTPYWISISFKFSAN